MKNIKNKPIKLLRFIPLILTVLIIICCIIFLANHSFGELLHYTPDNKILAMFVLLGFFALKSMSFVFPLTALFIAAGAVYPLPIAIIINIFGITVCFSIPYIVGRLAGEDAVEKISHKHKNLRKLIRYTNRNNLFASYLTRAVIIVPCDVGSILHGALKTPYKPYIIGSILGIMPELLVQTYIGDQIGSLTLKSVIIMLLLTILTLSFSAWLNKKTVNV